MNETYVSTQFLSRIQTLFLTEDGQLRAEKFCGHYVVVHHAQVGAGVHTYALQEGGDWAQCKIYSSSDPYGPAPKLYASVMEIPAGFKDC